MADPDADADELDYFTVSANVLTWFIMILYYSLRITIRVVNLIIGKKKKCFLNKLTMRVPSVTTGNFPL